MSTDWTSPPAIADWLRDTLEAGLTAGAMIDPSDLPDGEGVTVDTAEPPTVTVRTEGHELTVGVLPEGGRSPGDGITMASGVNVLGDGFVALAWGDQAGQLTPAEVRVHALALLQTAEAAENDAALYQVCRTMGAAAGDDGQMLAQLIVGQVRELRDAWSDR